MISRRRILGSLSGAGALTAAYSHWIEAGWLELTQTPVKIGRDPFRIVHLSDLHAAQYAVPLDIIEHAVESALAAKPDLICLTGDYKTARWSVDLVRYGRALKRLASAAPVFAVLGNHDGGAWDAQAGGHPDHSVTDNLLIDAGVHLLHNANVSITVRGGPLNVVGVGDYWSGETMPDRAFTGVEEGPTVLLSHNPDSKEVLGAHPWNLMLCGHTHGGQVILPLDGPRYAPVWDKRYVAGLNPWNDRQIFVTRGVGSLLGVRFRCRPEVSVLLVS